MDESKDVKLEIVRQVVAGVVIVLTALASSEAARIEAKALYMRARSWWTSWNASYESGERWARWLARDQRADVITEAERITKEEQE